MKTYYRLLLFVFFGAIFASCSTDVEFYADYKDMAIIYSVLDFRDDTSYVKITRAFCGTNDDPIDANEVALIADSSNYPGKLDARIVELKSGDGGIYELTGREIMLDTMTIHDKEAGAFYSPDQKIYYTTERLNVSTNGSRYKYRLIVVKPDGDTVKAQTTMVGSEEFRILSSNANFQLTHTDDLGKIVFKADGMASLYDVKIQFNYSEQHAGEELKWKNVSRSFGTRPLNEYQLVDGSENAYYLEYSLNWLFNALGSAIGGDTVVDGNHPNVVRHIGSFVISITAGGDDLSIYYSANQAQLNSPMSLVTMYTNIDGGYGLFSSRTTIEKTANLSYYAMRDLYAKTAWGFKEQ
jgi:hypothetical protein